MQIKGDYEAISTGYEQYIAKEVHNTQLINFLQTIGSLPQLQQYIKYEAFSRPLLRAFNLDPEQVMKTEEQVAQEMTQQAEAQKQAIVEQAQQQAQIAQQQIQAQAQATAQSQIQVQQIKSVLDEKQKVSDDQREMERAERLELIKDGNILHPTNLERHSILLREEVDASEVSAMMQEEQEEQQLLAQQQQMQQLQQQQQMQQQQQQGGQGGQGEPMAGAPEQGVVEQGAM
jgi:hypothetical protein